MIELSDCSVFTWKVIKESRQIWKSGTASQKFAYQSMNTDFFLRISMLSTQTITKTVDMPACQYSLRADFLDGKVIKATTVGRKVFHRWDCEAGDKLTDKKDCITKFLNCSIAQDTINVYGMKVHSCFASNSRGSRKVLVIDETG